MSAGPVPANPAPSLPARAPRPGRAEKPDERTERFRARLSERIGSHRFGLWFEHGTAIAVDRSSITVTAANAYVRDWILRNFREPLEQIAGEVVGPECSVDVAIAAGTDPVLRDAGSRAEHPAARGADAEVATLRVAADDPRRRAPAARQATLRRLDDFVVGEANRLAYAASRQLGEGSAEAPSILFLHGECGVGKTHLLQGLCRRRSERAPRQVVKYLTAEQFTNEYIAAVRDGSLDAFRKRLRRVDLLAIDDVHFFANKTATQAEFLHTVDAIDLSGARVAIVSDEHPRHIRRFSQSLVSRFLSGMVVKVDRPDRGTRLELVRRLARERGLDLTTAAEDSVAGRCTGSIREIEGAITRLGALVELDGMRGQIGPGTVDRLLGEELGPTGGAIPIRLGHIVEAVCDRMRVSREDLLGNGRHPRTVAARGLVAHLSRELTTHSYPEIARALGRDTHSAVHTAAKRIKSLIDDDQRLGADGEPVRELVDQLRHDIVRASRNRPL
jgi:chromosomal replication initiator protein